MKVFFLTIPTGRLDLNILLTCKLLAHLFLLVFSIYFFVVM